MKAKRILSIVLVVIFVFTTASVTFASPQLSRKGRCTPPGILKKIILSSNLSQEEAIEMIKENAHNLPNGILKEVILDADLCYETIEELYEEGFLDHLPQGILKNILCKYKDYDDEDDEDDDEDEDGDEEYNDEIEVKGVITHIDAENRIIGINEENYNLPERVEVEIDGEDAGLKDLKVGMKVELEIEDNEAEIEAENKEQTIEVNGTITDIDLEDKIIVIDEKEYQLPERVEVEIDEEDAELEDLEIGMEVELEIEDNKAQIKAESIEKEQIEIAGSITDIDLVGNYHITIDEVEYTLSRDAKVTIGQQDASLKDLKISMTVTAVLHDNEVVEIKAQYLALEIAGSITGIDLENRYIQIDGENYKLAGEVLVKISNENKAVEDLKVEMNLKAELVNGEIVEINAEYSNELQTKGIIMEVNTEESYIVIGNDKYKLAQNLEVKVNGEDGVLENLEIGMIAQVQLVDEEIVKIYVFDIQKIEGEITDIDLVGIYHLSIDEVKYELLREALVKINDEESLLSNLKLAMKVVVSLINNNIIFIDAEMEEIDEEVEITEVQGNISEINIEEKYISIENEKYYLQEELELIMVNEQQASLEDLAVSMDIEVELKNGLISKIVAKDKVEEFSGKIVEITFTVDGMKLTIETDTQETVKYLVSKELKGDNNEVLKLGDYGQFRVVNEIIAEATIEI